MGGKRIPRGVAKVAGYLISALAVGLLILLAVAYYAGPVTAPMVHDAPLSGDAIPAS